MERLKGISIFVEAVEAGGFSAAAERLNLTRSAVGKTIARLEQRLGVRLFNRTTRMQSLTEEGRFFYERCLRAVEEIRLGEAMLESGWCARARPAAHLDARAFRPPLHRADPRTPAR